MNCKYCRANCTGAKHDREIALCLGYDPPKTNGDFIRSMSDEELAEFLFHAWNNASWCSMKECPDEDSCLPCWLDWLRQEGKMKKPPKEVSEKHMEVCNKCPVRKSAAKRFDMHFDWLDCWYDCQNDYEHWLKECE